VGNGSPESITVQESNGTQSDWSTHIMTQVDKLRAEGLTGKGLRIGLVDSGVDYKHPALGGCFGDGCLVSFGHDLTGDDFDGSNAPVEDEDPRDSCFGHGTHVAGIIAAQTNPHGFTGAAPDVSLGMFKASGCSGYTSTDILMAALSKAHEAGSDIISCSAGASSGWSEEPWAILASRIVAEGVPVIFSAGNSGALGLFYASTPASGDGVASIGSTDNVNVPLILTSSSFRVDDGTEEQFGWIPGSPALGANLTLPLWAASTDVNDGPDACEPLADDTPDLTNRVPLVRLDETGQCTPTVQAKNLAKKGGRFVLYYSQSNTYVSLSAFEGLY
jgi:subtilisin family serine protease